MPEYSGLLRPLLVGLFALVGLFLVSALLRAEAFLSPVVYSITIIMLAILILARFGGNRGETI